MTLFYCLDICITQGVILIVRLRAHWASDKVVSRTQFSLILVTATSNLHIFASSWFGLSHPSTVLFKPSGIPGKTGSMEIIVTVDMVFPPTLSFC